MSDAPGRDTKYLNDPRLSNSDTFLPVRATGPLNDALPWVIEFRVAGTAATIQAQVHEEMLIGRADATRGIYPAVDLGPHGGQTRGVSRQHAMIVVSNNKINIRDLGSLNGTRINGALLAPNEDYRLRHGDEIEVGQIKLQVRFAVTPTIGKAEKGTGGTAQKTVPLVGRGQHVLIVEDDQDVAKVFSIAMRHAGFRVSVVDNAARAMSLVDRDFPDLILLDLILPDLNGQDVMRYVRRLPKGDQVRIIVCSGATGGFQMHQAIQSGADLFLGKPVSIEDLIKGVLQVLRLEVPESVPKP